MQIVCSEFYEEELKKILEDFSKEDLATAKNFKLYLDTIIVNIPTKVNKYKKSIFFHEDSIKDVEHQGFRIPFYIDKENDTYVLLGILKA